MENTLLADSIIGHTICGVNRSEGYPLNSGNCFSVRVGDHEYRIVNFAIENLMEAVRRGITLPVAIRPLSNTIAVIHDSRIPDDWYQDTWCEACCPESLLPLPQQLAHQRQEEQGFRKITEGGVLVIRPNKRLTL